MQATVTDWTRLQNAMPMPDSRSGWFTIWWLVQEHTAGHRWGELVTVTIPEPYRGPLRDIARRIGVEL